MNNLNSISDNLGKNIKELGILLGEVLIEQEGKELFDVVERMRKLSKDLRNAGNIKNISEIRRIVAGLSFDKASQIIKAFSIYFILVNAMDEVNIVLQSKKNDESGNKNNDYFGIAANKIKKLKLSQKEIKLILDKIEVIPVFTAHPTEATRQTILKKISRISNYLINRELYSTGKDERNFINEKIKTEITLLWQSNDLRFSKITVEDEVMRGVFFFKEVIYQQLPNFYNSLESVLEKNLNYKDTLSEIIKFSSWIGGDRDGHPFVTEEITKNTFQIHRKEIINLYLKDLNAVYDELSSSNLIVKASKKMMASIKKDQTLLGITENDRKFREPSEIYRSKLLLIYQRLSLTISNKTGSYNNSTEFLHDLYLIKESLLANKGELISNNIIEPFIKKVKTFGFYFVKLDIRQNASFIQGAVSEIINKVISDINYNSLSEDRKVQLLTKEILNNRPLINKFVKISNSAEKVIKEFGLIRWAKNNISIESAGDFIISNSSKTSDVLAALLLAKENGLVEIDESGELKSCIDILPLFETITDLRNSKKIMEELFANSAYSKHLAARNNEQKIMLGYSDSNKDGGIVASNYELYKTQIKLQELTKQKNIKLTLFHGRGGSISRGGGPVNKSILSQPSGTIDGKIKITEQGEMISSKYLIPQIAEKSMEIMTSAVIEQTARTLRSIKYAKRSEYIARLENFSQYSFDKYRSLLETDGFIEYFRTVTPIDIIEVLEIGSRPPARKKQKDLSSLRAIPWVFSWTQNRQTISGWFGFGTAVEKSIINKELTYSELQTMYNEWSFFKTLIQNIEMVLTKTDMIIAKEYTRLTKNKKLIQIFNVIEEEYRKSVEGILKITGNKELLDTDKELQRRLNLRNPYIDPISFIQIAMISKYRSERSPRKKNEVLKVIRSSVNGVAAGIRNTG